MKMIDVLVKQANKEIEDDTVLKVLGEELFGKKAVVLEFEFYRDNFYPKDDLTAEELYQFDTDFLNSEVELIPPKEKKYLIKVKIQGLHEDFAYLNYSELQSYVMIDSKFDDERCRTHFAKKELQSIQPIREFLEDMQGKYELIEVTDDEDD